MDAKVKKILEDLNSRIESNELSAALKADNFEGEYALSDDGVKAIADQINGLMTEDSAINNPNIVEKISKDLYPKHMKSFMTKFEGELKPLLDELKVDYSKYEYISDAIKDIKPKLAELTGGDSKELVESLKEDIRKEKEKSEELKEKYENELKERDEKMRADKMYQIFKSNALSKPWAEAYSIPDVKEAILKQTWDKLNAKAHLKLSDDGEIIPMQKEFPDKELYNGNKVETFQSLLEPEVETFIKKSDPKNPSINGKLKDDSEMSAEEKARIAEYNRQKERAAKG